MNRLFAVVILCICLLVTPCLFAQEKPTEVAQKAAESWLALVDNGDYGASWEESASIFKAAVTKEQWQKMVSNSRGGLGKLVSRKLKSSNFTTSLPGAPDGKYVVIQYETSFENKKSGIETITPMLDKDGQWRVSGYFIR